METIRDRVKAVGLLDRDDIAVDFAIPQAWSEGTFKKGGLWPFGVVWLYDDESRIFGRPYPVTMYGWWVCKLAGEEIPPVKTRRS